MRFRDTLKFALELFAPDKPAPAGGSSAPVQKGEASPGAAATAEIERASPHQKARQMIEQLDHGQFGGPSFGPQTIELMSTALEDAAASSGEPASDQQLRRVAAKLLQAAGDGERDPVRLKAVAILALYAPDRTD